MTTNYNPQSLKADEFISNDEILDTLKYADENKNNMPVIEQILAKARLEKGLTHREAAVLLACDNPEVNEQIFALAKQIKLNYVCSALSFKLLRKQLRLLPISC